MFHSRQSTVQTPGASWVAITNALRAQTRRYLVFAIFLWFSMPATAQRRQVWGVVTDNRATRLQALR